MQNASAVIDEVNATLPLFVTSSEARALLRISERQLYRLLAERKLEAIRHVPRGSSRLMIPRQSVVQYLESIMEGVT